MAGLGGLSKDAQAGLKESLAGQSAPSSPTTPSNPQDRVDPNQATSLDFQRVHHLLTRLKEALELTTNNLQDDSDPRQLFLGGINAGVELLLRDKKLPDAADIICERLFPLTSQTLKQRLQAMYAPISPPTGLGGGAQPPGATPGANPSPAGGATGQPPGGGQPPMPGDAGALPA